jgi:uncharacterized membrane-anchored protein YhcB (DUF1043 family)
MSASLLLTIGIQYIFYNRRLKRTAIKLKDEYNEDIEKKRQEVDKYEKELKEKYNDGEKIINILLRLIDEYRYWVETGEETSKLALQGLLENLPEEVKDKVKITI